MVMTNGQQKFWNKCLAILGSELVDTRSPKGVTEILTVSLAVSLSLFMIICALTVVSFYIFLTVYFGLTTVLVFILYPARKKSPERITVVDFLLIAATIAMVVYFITQFEAMEDRVGSLSQQDFFFGTLAVIVSLESCRRVLGPLLPGLGVLLLVYCLFGAYFPGDLAHKGFSLQRVFEYLYSLEGIFGVITRTYASYIFLFILFGSFLIATKTGDFFIDMALCLVGRGKGGAAKVAVLGSGFIGSIVGSGSANVAITGIFTIPMMIKTGFKPHIAAAIEAAASIGGHITPPVMGSVIFLLASLTNTPYIDIVIISIVPAILWYFSLYVAIHFYAAKYGLTGMKKEELPDFWSTFRKGWPLMIPVVMLIVMLAMRYSPHMAAVYSIFGMFVIAMLKKETRFSPRSLIRTLSNGAKGSLALGATAGTMGIILGGITFPGLALKFSSLIISYSHNILPLALVLILLAAYVLGMGMTVTPAYVVLAILAAPAMIEMGVPLLTAHLAIVWFTQSSPLTPPFCLAAFVGAGIAKANPMKTGFASVRLGFVMYVVPFIMVYRPAFLMNAAWWEICLSYIASFIAVGVIAISIIGFFKGPLRWFTRILLTLSAGLLLFGDPLVKLVGIVVMLSVAYKNKMIINTAPA
ncbi:MAG: TRAP transporter fused permease subunit [Desulfobacterales bacterium]|nr:TRAP transporter fused permease subunit [Desulfobacterales bacterium]